MGGQGRRRLPLRAAVRRVEAGPLWTSPLSFCCSLVTVGAY